MAKNISKFHPKPCGNCGHTDMHGEVSGCVNMPTLASWCDCAAYVSPRDREAEAREGRKAAQKGMDAASASHAMTVSPEGPEWRDKALERLDVLIARGTDFTAEDVTDVVGVAPSPSAIGSLFNSRAFKDRAVQVGWTDATRKVAHGRPLRVWKAR